MTYQKRNQYLLIGLIVSLLLVYQLAIKKTIALVTEKEMLSNAFYVKQNEPAIYRTLVQQLTILNTELGYGKIADTEEEVDFLERIAALSKENNVILKDFPAPHRQEKEDGFLIETAKVTLTGNYANLLRVLHAIERSSLAGRISSVDFSIILDRERKKQLVLHIYWKKMSKIQAQLSAVNKYE